MQVEGPTELSAVIKGVPSLTYSTLLRAVIPTQFSLRFGDPEGTSRDHGKSRYKPPFIRWLWVKPVLRGTPL